MNESEMLWGLIMSGSNPNSNLEPEDISLAYERLIEIEDSHTEEEDVDFSIWCYTD